MHLKAMVTAVALTALTPGLASAQTCLSVYYSCLNATWDTSGLARLMADVECGARYFGCIRKTIV